MRQAGLACLSLLYLKALLALCSPSAAITLKIMHINNVNAITDITIDIMIAAPSSMSMVMMLMIDDHHLLMMLIMMLIMTYDYDHDDVDHHHLCSRIPRRLRLGGHRPLQVLRHSHVFHLFVKK